MSTALQVVELAVLIIVAVLLVIALLSLNKIAAALGAVTERLRADAPSSGENALPPTGTEEASTEGDAAVHGTGTPLATAAAAAGQGPAAVQTEPAEKEPWPEERREAAEPRSSGESEPASMGASASAATPAAQDGPREQPFERDGRWWFKRGDELLVYDEVTSQWVTAETAAASPTGGFDLSGSSQNAGAGGSSAARRETSGAPEPSLAAQPASNATTETAAEQSELEEQTVAGQGWKCSSCGAVNASSSSTCRMCFAARS